MQEIPRPGRRGLPWTFLPSGPEVAGWTGPRRPTRANHNEVRRVLREFAFVRFQDASDQTRLGFGTDSVGTQKDDARGPAAKEERQVAEVLVLSQQDPVLRVGQRENLIITYTGGGLGHVGNVVVFTPQARNDLPLHALVS